MSLITLTVLIAIPLISGYVTLAIPIGEKADACSVPASCCNDCTEVSTEESQQPSLANPTCDQTAAVDCCSCCCSVPENCCSDCEESTEEESCDDSDEVESSGFRTFGGRRSHRKTKYKKKHVEDIIYYEGEEVVESNDYGGLFDWLTDWSWMG